jgi:hypothetical protein
MKKIPRHTPSNLSISKEGEQSLTDDGEVDLACLR